MIFLFLSVICVVSPCRHQGSASGSPYREVGTTHTFRAARPPSSSRTCWKEAPPKACCSKTSSITVGLLVLPFRQDWITLHRDSSVAVISFFLSSAGKMTESSWSMLSPWTMWSTRTQSSSFAKVEKLPKLWVSKYFNEVFRIKIEVRTSCDVLYSPFIHVFKFYAQTFTSLGSLTDFCIEFQFKPLHEIICQRAVKTSLVHIRMCWTHLGWLRELLPWTSNWLWF